MTTPPRTHLRPRRVAVRATAMIAAVSLLAAGCSRGDASDSATGTRDLATPVEITNCDRSQTFTSAPQRIISMNGHVTETLIQMGVADRIVGKAYGERAPLPELAEKYNAIPTLADKYPTWEQVRDLEPDFVVGGMSSAFTRDERMSRNALEADGIATFLFSEYCGAGFSDISLLKKDYTQLGEVLAVPDAAKDLTEKIIGGLDGIRTRLNSAGVKDVPTFFYDSGESEPLTISRGGIGNLIGTYAGAENITPEGEKPYVTSSWEVVGERAPEAVVVLDYGDQTAEKKIAFLKAQPIIATTPAARNNRFVVVPLSDFFESSRMVTSADIIARALHPSAFATR